MNILDIFYNEVVNEAKEGEIKSYFTFNIAFEIDCGEIRTYNSAKFDNIIVPTLRISDKERFDELLVEYVLSAREFYPLEDFYFDDLEEDKIEKERIKTLISYLFSNATYDDFNNPCEFIQRRIDFINNTKEEKYALGYSNELKSNLSIDVMKDSLCNETPYQFSLVASNDGEEVYRFPSLKFGISHDKAYIYAIQNPNPSYEKNKKINRALYKIGEGFNAKEDNYKLYEEGNLKDVTASFLMVANTFLGYLKNIGIEEIFIPSILIERWNAKQIANEKKLEDGRITKEVYEERSEKHDNLQSNLTEKLLRTFLRLTSHYPNIEVLSYPSDETFSLNMNISNLDNCNNKLLSETLDLVSCTMGDKRHK